MSNFRNTVIASDTTARRALLKEPESYGCHCERSAAECGKPQWGQGDRCGGPGPPRDDINFLSSSFWATKQSLWVSRLPKGHAIPRFVNSARTVYPLAAGVLRMGRDVKKYAYQ